jgi:hypothetical protein
VQHVNIVKTVNTLDVRSTYGKILEMIPGRRRGSFWSAGL